MADKKTFYNVVAGAKTIFQITMAADDALAGFDIVLDRAVSLRHENISLFRNGALLVPGMDYSRIDRSGVELPTNFQGSGGAYPIIHKLRVLSAYAGDTFVIVYSCFSGDWIDYNEIQRIMDSKLVEMITTGDWGEEIRDGLADDVAAAGTAVETALTTYFTDFIDNKSLSDASGLGKTIGDWATAAESQLETDLEDYIDTAIPPAVAAVSLDDSTGLGKTISDFIAAVSLTDPGLGATIAAAIADAISGTSLADTTGLGKAISDFIADTQLTDPGLGTTLKAYIDGVSLADSSGLGAEIKAYVDGLSLDASDGLGKTIKDYIDSL
jgi:hypothetical protein